jgi:hypothetical protein
MTLHRLTTRCNFPAYTQEVAVERADSIAELQLSFACEGKLQAGAGWPPGVGRPGQAERMRLASMLTSVQKTDDAGGLIR